MNNVLVSITVEINLTEDLEKVKQAVENIFGDVPFKVESSALGQMFIVETSGFKELTKLSTLLKREQIRSAARKVLLRGLNEKSLTFYLNKQVAYVGHISFSQETSESPLGPIKVQVRCSDPRKLVDWLAPRLHKKITKNPPRRPK